MPGIDRAVPKKNLADAGEAVRRIGGEEFRSACVGRCAFARSRSVSSAATASAVVLALSTSTMSRPAMRAIVGFSTG